MDSLLLNPIGGLMRYAITGAGGFIGKHTVASLLNRGYPVVLIDTPSKLTTVKDFLKELENIGYKFGQNAHSLIRLQRQDLLKNFNLEQLLDGSDIVLHLASVSNPRVAAYEPEITRKMNVELTKRLLGTGRYFVFASSYLLYCPRTFEFYAGEETPISNQARPYEKSKLEAENLITNEGKYLICRLSNNYGQCQDMGFLVPDAIKRINESTGLVEIFNPTSVRDFIFVQDTAEALISLIEGTRLGVFNIGTGKGCSIREVYNIIAHKLGKGLLSLKMVSDDNNFLVADVSKIKETGWKPLVSLEEGIERTVRLTKRFL